MDKAMTAVLGVVMGLGMIMVVASMIQGMTPPPQPGAYDCPYCDMSFDTLEELIEHVATAHPDEPPIEAIDIGWD